MCLCVNVAQFTGSEVAWTTLGALVWSHQPRATGLRQHQEGEYEMMSSTEIQVGLSNILNRFADSLSTAERDALYETLDGVASGLFDDRS